MLLIFDQQYMEAIAAEPISILKWPIEPYLKRMKRLRNVGVQSCTYVLM